MPVAFVVNRVHGPERRERLSRVVARPLADHPAPHLPIRAKRERLGVVLLERMSRITNGPKLDTLLARAARSAASNGMTSDDFMSAAWEAFLDSHPGMRQALEEKELRAQLKKLRKRGLVASA